MSLLIAGFIAGCSLIGAYVSIAKGRQAIEGAVLGGLLGPIGVPAAAFLPTQEPGWEPNPTPAPDSPFISRAERTWFEKLPSSVRDRSESRNLRI